MSGIDRGQPETPAARLRYVTCFSTDPQTDRPMKTLARRLLTFLRKEDGPTAVEYAVMLALIIVVCIVAITTLGTNSNKTYSKVGSAIGSSAS